MSVSNNVTGSGLLIAGGQVGFIGWITQNATFLSLALTFLSVIGGLFFLFLNYLETRRHNRVLQKAALSNPVTHKEINSYQPKKPHPQNT